MDKLVFWYGMFVPMGQARRCRGLRSGGFHFLLLGSDLKKLFFIFLFGNPCYFFRGFFITFMRRWWSKMPAKKKPVRKPARKPVKRAAKKPA